MKNLKLEFWWAVHNLIAHPVSQILWWLSGCGTIRTINDFGNWVHDVTIPNHKPGTGRG
jgi:hypothetical protein